MATPLTKGETPLHKSIVRALITYFQGRGWEIVAAAAEGYAPPSAQGRHEPDVVASTESGVIVIGEAKTGEGDIDTEHSREQYADFAGRVMKGTEVACPFCLCVPRQHDSAARLALQHLGVLGKPTVTVLIYG